MSAIFDINDRSKPVQFAGRLDYCFQCAKKKTIEENIAAGEAEIILRGKLEGKKAMVINWRGTRIVMCEKCAKEIEENSRPTWQIISNRVFQKSLKNV